MSGELIRPEIMGRLARSKDYARFRWMIESVVHNIIHTEVVGDLDTEVAPNGKFTHSCPLDFIQCSFPSPRSDILASSCSARQTMVAMAARSPATPLE